MYSSIPAVDVPAAAPAPKRSYTRLAAVPAVMALLAFAGVAGYSQLKAQRVVTPARGMVTALAQTIAAKSQGDDYYAPDVSCTEMESVFNRCIDSEASFGGDYTCGDIATFALDYACNGTSALASGIFDYLVEVYEEIGICKELTKMMGHCFTESGHWGTWCESAHADIVQGESEDLGCTMTWYGARSDDAPLFPGSTDSGDDASSSSEKELNTQEYAYYDSLPTPGAISPKKSVTSVRATVT